MMTVHDTLAAQLRRGLLWLGALTTVGTLVELTLERHWTQPSQLIAWAALAANAAAVVLLARAVSPGRVRLAQILAAVAMVSAVVGVWEHVAANYEAGELDRRYASSWEQLSEPTRWWLALTKSVGPSPPLAPGVLAQAGLCVLLATQRHPALRKERAPEPVASAD